MSVAVEIGGNPGFFISVESEVTRRLNGSNGGLVLWKFHPVKTKERLSPLFIRRVSSSPFVEGWLWTLFFLCLSCARARSRSLPLLKLLCTSLLSSRGSCLSLRYSSVHAFFVAVSFLFVNALWEIILSVLYFQRLSVVDNQGLWRTRKQSCAGVRSTFFIFGKISKSEHFCGSELRVWVKLTLVDLCRKRKTFLGLPFLLSL
jgi:hypothetical protein